MDPIDKNKIIHLFPKLVEDTNLDELLPRLEAKTVFPEMYFEQFRNAYIPLSDRKRKLYIEIQKRGPLAFGHLLDALRESGHWDLCDRLQNNEPRQSNDVTAVPKKTHPFQLPTHEAYPSLSSTRIRDIAKANPGIDINLISEHLIIKVRKATRFLDSPIGSHLTPYSMRSNPRGVLLLFNNLSFINNVQEERVGGEVDETNLKELFKQLNFQVFAYSNQTKVDMLCRIRNFKTHEVLKKADCFFLAMMSHGTEGHTMESTNIITADGIEVNLSDIATEFDGYNCPLLRNKPKVFVFQLCRGKLGDNGTQTQMDGGVRRNVPRHGDTLICHSTTPGYIAHRDPTFGSWFIHCLCKVFMEHAHKYEVTKLFDLITEEVRMFRSENNTMQTPVYTVEAFRPCFLNPGL